MPTIKPPTPSPAPMQREVVVEPLRCEDQVPEAPIPEPPRAANAADAIAEENAIRAWGAQLSARLEALWKCVRRHDERAEKTR